MTDEPDVPVIRVLARPIVAGRYTTIDFEELRELANAADEAADPGLDPAEALYAYGVRDTLQWLADGVVTAELLRLLGG